MALETRLAAENLTKEQLRDVASNYKKYALDELPELLPSFNWDGWMKTFEECGVELINPFEPGT